MIDTPTFGRSEITHVDSRDQAKEVLLDLIAASGGVFSGSVRLHKAFYYAHLYYWRFAGGVLSDHPIVKAPRGPLIDDAKRLIAELVDAGLLTLRKTPVGPFEESVYVLNGDRSIDRSTSRGGAIHDAVTFVEGQSATDLTATTHEHSISWHRVNLGEEMNVYLDVMDEDELAEIRTEIARVRTREAAAVAK